MSACAYNSGGMKAGGFAWHRVACRDGVSLYLTRVYPASLPPLRAVRLYFLSFEICAPRFGPGIINLIYNINTNYTTGFTALSRAESS